MYRTFKQWQKAVIERWPLATFIVDAFGRCQATVDGISGDVGYWYPRHQEHTYVLTPRG